MKKIDIIDRSITDTKLRLTAYDNKVAIESEDRKITQLVDSNGYIMTCKNEVKIFSYSTLPYKDKYVVIGDGPGGVIYNKEAWNPSNYIKGMVLHEYNYYGMDTLKFAIHKELLFILSKARIVVICLDIDKYYYYEPNILADGERYTDIQVSGGYLWLSTDQGNHWRVDSLNTILVASHFIKFDSEPIRIVFPKISMMDASMLDDAIGRYESYKAGFWIGANITLLTINSSILGIVRCNTKIYIRPYMKNGMILTYSDDYSRTIYVFEDVLHDTSIHKMVCVSPTYDFVVSTDRIVYTDGTDVFYDILPWKNIT